MGKRNKKWVLLLLACAMLFVSGQKVRAAGYEDLFDAQFYADANPDLKLIYGNNPAALYQHFIGSGIYEGRLASPMFDVVEYRKTYPDLQAVLGNDYSLYYQHYLNSGVREGRSGCGLFDAWEYANANYDVYRAYGYNPKALYNHFITVGIDEGRKDGMKFNTYCYMALNQDLAKMSIYQSRPALLFRQYVTAGLAEGRKGAKPDSSYAALVCDSKGHYVKEWNIITESDCKKDGLKSGNCEVCGRYIEKKISSDGHTAGKILAKKTIDGKKYIVVRCAVCKKEYLLDD